MLVLVLLGVTVLASGGCFSTHHDPGHDAERENGFEQQQDAEHGGAKDASR
jgi:hypothetical protein